MVRFQDALGFGARELSGALVIGVARLHRFADLAVDGLVVGLVVVLVLGWALDLVAGPARPATLAAGRFLGRGSADRLRVAERRREHEREERDERELHGGVTPHGEVGRWWGRGRKESGCGGRVRGARACERWLAFAVPVRELMVFSDAKSDISVAGTANARSNRPSAIAWRPAL